MNKEISTKTKTVKVKRLTLDLPEDLHKAIKLRAVEEGKTMVEILRAILDSKFKSKAV